MVSNVVGAETRRLNFFGLVALLFSGFAFVASTTLVNNVARAQELDGVEELEPLSDEAQAAADRLEQELDPESEAGQMLQAILNGQPMGPTDGWFATARSLSRYTMDYLVERFDRDGDALISKAEFSGLESDWARIDRNRDGMISSEDLKWEVSQGPREFRRISSQIDLNADGSITKAEAAQFAQRLTGDRIEISMEELRQVLAPAEVRPNPFDDEEPSRSVLVLGLDRQEIGSHNPGPELNGKAPDFELESLDGEVVRLSDRIGTKPVVLLFGNYTCGPFRWQSGNLKSLYQRYQDRVEFLMIYVREAHPEDGWHMNFNRQFGVELEQPKTLAERQGVAKMCKSHLAFDIPILVDTLADEVGHAYSGGPARLYLIDRQGRVVYKGGRGPFYFFPSELESAIVWNLSEASQK